MFGPPSYEEIELQSVMEFDTNSPRLRLSIIAYLLENGGLEVFDTIEDFAGAAEDILSFVTDGTSDFLTAVEAAMPAPAEAEVPMDDDTINGSGYNYL